jgi:predicted MFS family arabinose efflux permease
MAGGLCWAGFSLAAGNYLYDTVVPEKRAGYLAVHHVLSNVGIFLGALLGGFLASVLPAGFTLAGQSWQWASSLWAVMLVSALARGVVAALFLPQLREVRRVRPLGPLGVISRVLYARNLRAAWLRRARARARIRPIRPPDLPSTGRV